MHHHSIVRTHKTSLKTLDNYEEPLLVSHLLPTSSSSSYSLLLMDTTDRETHDFMNVSSFSQLPFIRPVVPPTKEKAGAIRLFGKEFGGSDHSDHFNENNKYAQPEAEANKDTNNTDSSRKFECHYCCRNFPTSQALGGHQNAHKRERQNAKRAHLQSAMLSDPNFCGIMNYSRMGSTPTLPIAYHSWNSNNSSSSSNHYGANSRLYGSHSPYNAHQRQPINGSPLSLWQIPVAHSSLAFNGERVSSTPMHQHIPLLNVKEDHMKPLSSVSSGLTSQSQFGYNSKPSKQDHVSLDLHL